ncbi:MAG: glycosyltransferase family 4 protein [Candidatus Methanoperedens sp.]|nr:glycosyltransferase family 4 protein [Candidatus Methanoperedens sp.]MCZ7359358.1 glycosyltransferase family 4 protein [Candidatus Methanoperedens sp.]HLB72111.1 glycosyltransferase family 4 protein [Candidatus Methanoperedens sp.]
MKQPKLTTGSTFYEAYSSEAANIAGWFDFTKEELDISKKLIEQNRGYLNIKKVAWFIPDFNNVFWGGIYTIFRFAAHLKEKNSVQNCFVIIGNVQKEKIVKSMGNAFPVLKDEKICILGSESEIHRMGEFDATICTLWTTAYHSLKFNKTKRKFYFIQDFEPLFYPAGSIYGQTDATYKFGFYGIANTMTLKDIYEKQYNGKAEYFTPCVNTYIFHPEPTTNLDRPFTVFFYARPGHPRNGFELGIAALKKLKNRMRNKVKIITAGANWSPHELGLEGVVENLGLLSYEETAELYRTCDVGLVMMFTRHPSYIPLELMASGCLVVTNLNPANTWLLHDRTNCLLSHASASSLCDTIEEGLTDAEQRKKLTANALITVRKYTDWDVEFGPIYSFMCDPDSMPKKIKIES